MLQSCSIESVRVLVRLGVVVVGELGPEPALTCRASKSPAVLLGIDRGPRAAVRKPSRADIVAGFERRCRRLQFRRSDTGLHQTGIGITGVLDTIQLSLTPPQDFMHVGGVVVISTHAHLQHGTERKSTSPLLLLAARRDRHHEGTGCSFDSFPLAQFLQSTCKLSRHGAGRAHRRTSERWTGRFEEPGSSKRVHSTPPARPASTSHRVPAA